MRESAPGEVVTICPDDAMFAKGTIHIEPKEEGDLIAVVTLNRGCGVPNYRWENRIVSDSGRSCDRQ